MPTLPTLSTLTWPNPQVTDIVEPDRPRVAGRIGIHEGLVQVPGRPGADAIRAGSRGFHQLVISDAAPAPATSVLTDGRRVSVINAPAGSGKTRVMAEITRTRAGAWLGPVIGVTASESARNTLSAGVTESHNSAQFLWYACGSRREPAGRAFQDPNEDVEDPD
jgi:hypothetical protein